jgi:hypothetical protein
MVAFMAVVLVGFPAVGGSVELPLGLLRAGTTTCAIPHLPRAGQATGTSGAPRMTGPAVTSLTGYAARHPFSIDGSNLVVQPPRSGDHPTISAAQAECDALSSLNAQNAAMSADVGSGLAIGDARVTLAAHLFPAASGPPGTDTTPGDVQPKMPLSTRYRNRLAWVVVMVHRVVINCPDMSAPPATVLATPAGFEYQVFLVDARSGRNALVYAESQPNPCGFATRLAASLIQPRQEVSVPWVLQSRSANGYSGTIRATVLPCAGYSNPVLIDRSDPGLQVVVTQPVGASCGPPTPITLGLHAATVNSELPPAITHDPVGLYTGLAAPSQLTTISPRGSEASLVNLSELVSGTTIMVRVGQVVVVTPGGNLVRMSGFVSPVVSSDPVVLGGLGGPQPLAAEFRAWKPGRAELSVPASACRYTVTPGASCWTAHVVVS